MANIVKTTAIVLRTIRFKESSLIATLLTKRFGRIKVLAKGIKRPKSRICGSLEPFNFIEVIFYKKEYKEIYTLSDAAILNYFEGIRSHPQKVNVALVLCEFFDKTLPIEEYESPAFPLLLSFLKNIDIADKSEIKSLLSYYLLWALSVAGVMPYLKDCVRCHRAINKNNKKIDFSISAGGVVCDEHFDDTTISLSKKTVNILLQIYNKKIVQIDEDTFNEIEKIIPNYLFFWLNGIRLNSLSQLN
jgi:DNA repair protein RecO (recombination protein O)